MHIEITIRDNKQLPNIINLLSQLELASLHLTDKNGLPDNVNIAKEIITALPKQKIIPHYSFKNHTRKDPAEIKSIFLDYLKRATLNEIKQILLVSGSPKPKFDTLEALQYLQTQDSNYHELNFAVCYNPFLIGENLSLEQKRLKEKLKHSQVTTVCLQIGSLLQPLQDGIAYLQKLAPNTEIKPSIVIPTENFLRKFKEKPWKGVYLDEKYLSNVPNAMDKTKELLQICHKLEIKPLIEILDLTNLDIEELRSN